MKKILVTGGAGFVGRHMIRALLAKGFEVRVIDNFSCSSPRVLDPFKGKIDLIRGDIRDPKAVQKAVKGVDVVFHFAAIRSVAKSVEDPLLAHEVNSTGALLLLEHSLRAKVKHFIFTSTSAVYGAEISDLQKEEGPFCPISPYGVAKLAAEGYASYYTSQLGLPTTSVRIFNVYGPEQNPESKYSLVVPGVMSKISQGEAPVIDGTGKQARDFVYIGDVLEAFFKILGNPKSYGRVYNLGSGKTTSILSLVQTLLKLSNSKLKAVHGPQRPGDPDRTCASIARIQKELGWKPKVGLEEGLKKSVEWYLK